MNKSLKRLVIGMAMLTLMASSVPTYAATLFTFNGDCSTTTCFGSTYTLIIGDAGDAVATTYNARLIINTSGYNGGITAPVFIDAADIKVVTSLISNTFALTGAPGGAAAWDSSFNTGQAATDCGSGGGFFFCARDAGTNTLAQVGGMDPLEWDWTFSSNNAIAFGHIGASYNNAAGTINGQNTSISSATSGTPGVPEPSTFILLGTGLVILGLAARRRYLRR